MNKPISLFWFRNDLRISDNPGLFEACKNHSIIPIYIFDKNENIGRASKIWLYNSLNSLNHSLDNKLNLYIGNPKDVLSQLIESYKIKEIFLKIPFIMPK